MRRPYLALVVSAVATLAVARVSTAAVLPPHAALRILVVSDEVNPHGLSNAELTQPGDISAALSTPGNGLNVETVTEIATDDLPTATTALSVPFGDPSAYDVLIYFAHRIPNGGAGAAEQAAFVASVEDFLEAGGGVVSFHHGTYFTAGKEAMLDLIGATASGAVPWDTVSGQNVINVAPSHFITTNGVDYTGMTAYADPGRGVAAGTYDFFNNTPDERYPQLDVNPGAGTIEVLFASNYNDSGTTHLLGFTHRRPGWAGVVVAYQPGEYQPNALDDVDGNNFQILANAIVYAAGEVPCACDDGNPCTQDVCVGGGCDFLDQPSLSCISAWQKASLQVKENRPGKEKLGAKWAKGPSLAQTALGNPLSPGGTAYDLCLYGETGTLVARLTVDRAGELCAGRACWRAVGGLPPAGKGYAYRDADASSDGVTAMTFKGSATGASKLAVKAKNNATQGETQLPTGITSALQGATQVTMQLHGDDLASCFSATLADVRKADPGSFKARK